MENTMGDTIGEAVNDILGQFFCAFGQGAGAIRIRRTTIAALRARYREPIQNSLAEWERSAPHVLSFVAQVGRLAALLATQAGRTAIGPADFTMARRAVEATVHQNAENSGQLFAGMICPAIPGEQPLPIKPDTPDVLSPIDGVMPQPPVATVTH